MSMHFLCTDSFYYCPKSLSTFWQREIFTMPQTTIHNTNSLRLIKYNSNSTAGIFIIINHLNIHPVIKAFNTFFLRLHKSFQRKCFPVFLPESTEILYAGAFQIYHIHQETGY